MTSSARRIVAWLLLFALAWSSAAPAFASRASAADLAALGICSMAGHDAGDDGDRQQDPAGSIASALHHCPFCAPAAHAALPAPAAAIFVAPADVASFVLPRPASPQRPVHPGSTCRPRGPPDAA
jgi:hypothetical protein